MADEPKIVGVAVRLICRYSNGVTKSFLGRAASFEEPNLRILCNEQFEAGIPLTVMSAFLPAARLGRVQKVERGPQIGSYFLDLRLKPPDPVLPKPVAPPPQEIKPVVSIPAAAAALATKLEAAGTAPYYTAVFESATIREKEAWAVSTAAALFLLLASKGRADTGKVLMRVKG